ncbi:hypothetical protein F5B22DRAFT_649241 [Xylaria bambusicola]|uniref:uncharacterized protein n=1 Tax=Xylaria bambusicola TaxID=326684 RepID=UPI002008AB25|nr:uncharacterized protein F5B22DRAFT_649241 [Xylaria bambusicola]KAI0509192.1 hypothetical protein F5B22DRAFT_649241 [Xylaria bambusicola]
MRLLTRWSPNHASLYILAQLILALCTASAQIISDDSIVYTTLAGWRDMRACAQCPFRGNAHDCHGELVDVVVGCQTNACLCRPSTLEQAVDSIDEQVLSLCSNYEDQRTATDFLLRYCSDHGYTSVATASVSPTGACLTAAAAAAATVTVTEIVTTTQTVVRSVRSETSSHETQTTAQSSESQPPVTSELSSSQITSTHISPSQTTVTISPTITPASSTISSTEGAGPTDTASSAKDSSDDKLKTTDLIGIIVGILSLLIAILTLCVSWKTGRPKRFWEGVASRRHTVRTYAA